jgi:ATP phosphoribosyltransferase regulatory subunit
VTALTSFLPQFFAARGCVMPHVGLLQPADPFLDTAGEDLRRRIFLTESETGEALCLRPEFTIPVCLLHLQSGAGLPRRYAYCGEVFRQRRAGGNEFLQAGIEDLGDARIATADARSLADAIAIVREAAPAASWRIIIGDQAMFEAVIRALGLPRGWRKKLSRAFGTPGQLDALLDALGGPRRARRGLPAAVEDSLEDGDAGALVEVIGRAMEEQGFAASGRSAGEIAHRLMEQSVLEQARLTPAEIALLRDFLSIRAALPEAVAALRAFSGRLDGGLGDAFALFEARAEALSANGVDPAAVIYDAAFGRPLDYYTGLVFEIAAGQASMPAVGGGRYDLLLKLLGAPDSVPGVGFSVWLDRLEAARDAGGSAS